MKIRRLTKAQLRGSAANGVAKAALTDQRIERAPEEAACLDLPPVPDFLARCEARIQAARAGS
jgi:hypothetical protein